MGPTEGRLCVNLIDNICWEQYYSLLLSCVSVTKIKKSIPLALITYNPFLCSMSRLWCTILRNMPLIIDYPSVVNQYNYLHPQRNKSMETPNGITTLHHALVRLLRVRRKI